MTDSSTDRTGPAPIVMSPPRPARTWTRESWRRWLRPGYGSRANARDAGCQLGPGRQRTLAWAWQIGHPSAVPPCGHVTDLHQCAACRAAWAQLRATTGFRE